MTRWFSPVKPQQVPLPSNMRACSVTQPCLTLCDLMDHGILQAKILERVAVSSSRGTSRPRDQTHISCTGRQILYHWANLQGGHLRMSQLGDGITKQGPALGYKISNERYTQNTEVFILLRATPCWHLRRGTRASDVKHRIYWVQLTIYIIKSQKVRNDRRTKYGLSAPMSGALASAFHNLNSKRTLIS